MGNQELELFRRHTAYHQAGHVIADLLSNYRLMFVTIRPDASGEDDGAVCGNARGRAQDLAVVQLAGIVASAQMTGRDPWEKPHQFDDDSADIAATRIFVDDWAGFLSRTYGESSLEEQLWDEIRNKTRLLVEQNREAIEGIANVLLERETLSYDEVIRILKDRCPDFTFGGKS
jgi:hypothetical protein